MFAYFTTFTARWPWAPLCTQSNIVQRHWKVFFWVGTMFSSPRVHLKQYNFSVIRNFFLQLSIKVLVYWYNYLQYQHRHFPFKNVFSNNCIVCVWQMISVFHTHKKWTLFNTYIFEIYDILLYTGVYLFFADIFFDKWKSLSWIWFIHICLR